VINILGIEHLKLAAIWVTRALLGTVAGFAMAAGPPTLGSRPIAELPESELVSAPVPHGTRSFSFNHGEILYSQWGTPTEDPVPFASPVLLLIASVGGLVLTFSPKIHPQRFALAMTTGVIAIGSLAFHDWMRESRAVDDGIVAWKNYDAVTAIQILEPYADRGNELAQDTVGSLYAYGQGVPRDRERARVLIRKARGREAPDSYLWIAKSFESGDGVAADPEETEAWYRIAADEGSAEAQQRLERKRSTGPSPSGR
jgi:hypothetical protein